MSSGLLVNVLGLVIVVKVVCTCRQSRKQPMQTSSMRTAVVLHGQRALELLSDVLHFGGSVVWKALSMFLLPARVVDCVIELEVLIVC